MLKQQEVNSRTKKTSHYDEICEKIKKVLSATAQTFIPELCDALRKDWFFEYTEAEIKNNKDDSRELIRRKIITDWSREESDSEYTIWKTRTIASLFPDWLRNPVQQLSTENARRTIIENRISKKFQLAEREKQALERYVKILPPPIPEPKPEPELIQTNIEMELAPEMQGLGEQGKDVMTIYGEINGAAQKLFKALTQRDELPGPDEDIIIDYVKPTRETRKAFVEELKHAQFLSVNSLQRNLAYLDHVLGDMLEILEEAKK